MCSVQSHQSALASYRLYPDDKWKALSASSSPEIHRATCFTLPSSLCKSSLGNHFDWEDSWNEDYAKRPLLLDLFSGAGGSALGYYLAGFRILGVDIQPQPRFPFEFRQADAMTFPLDGFSAIHASPPCQAYSIMRNLPWLRKKEYPRLIDPIRQRLIDSGVPWVIENVMGAKLPGLWLCGQMFGLPFFRHRTFETNWLWLRPPHPKHNGTVRNGRTRGSRARDIMAVPTKKGLTEYFIRNGIQGVACNVGRAAGVNMARLAMGIDWMTRDELTQAIPPAYTEFIGRQFLRVLDL